MCAFYNVVLSMYKSIFKPIRDNWADYKCNPAIIPFAGIIKDKAPDEVGIYTAANFQECSKTILEKIVIIFTKTNLFYIRYNC